MSWDIGRRMRDAEILVRMMARSDEGRDPTLINEARNYFRRYGEMPTPVMDEIAAQRLELVECRQERDELAEKLKDCECECDIRAIATRAKVEQVAVLRAACSTALLEIERYTGDESETTAGLHRAIAKLKELF